ncbi:MAG: hypothetical protein POELPBGB_00858 [Bacteroidia bacterium]|nr:hypothetical protein [Bacteroidia bacterium]
MRKIVVLIFILNLVQLCNAQTPQWIWAKYGLHTDYTEGFAVCIDSEGNTYLSGFFKGNTLVFGNTTLTNSDNTNSTFDIFIVKYDSDGNLQWAKSAAGPAADDWCYDMTCDALGNVLLTGFFRGSSITFSNTTLTNPGFFLVKFDGLGNVIWARDAIGNCETRSVVTDENNNIFITGWFNTSTLQIENITLTNGGFVGTKDYFIAKYDPSGNVEWAKKAGGIGNDQGMGVSTDLSGNVYVTGDFKSSTITFGTITLSNTNSDSLDVFVAKYNSEGTVIWANKEGGMSSDGGQCIVTSPVGNSYVTGWYYSSTFQFGNNTINRVGPWGNKDMFVAKYDSTGNVIWSKSVVSIYDVNAWSIALDMSENIFIAGGYAGTVDFGAFSLVSSGGIDPAFVVKYNSEGTEQCAFKLSSGGDDWLIISVDDYGNLYLGGDWAGASGISNLPVVGFENAFISKFRFNCEPVAIDNFMKDNCITTYPNPATTHITIEMNSLPIAIGNRTSNYECRIMNTTGQLVTLSVVEGQRSTFDISFLAPGLYLLQVFDESGALLKTEKVVKE